MSSYDRIIRIIPSFLLVSLNAKMIQRFHEVIERRNILQAKTFIEGSSKLSLANITDETIEGVETGGPEYEPRCQRKTQVGKVRCDDSEEEEEEEERGSWSCTETETETAQVICEILRLIVWRPQLGNNNKGGRRGEERELLYFGNVESKETTHNTQYTKHNLQSQSCKYSGKN